MSDTRSLNLDQVGFDPKYYPRVNGKPDWLTVHRYKEALLVDPSKADYREPHAFPPIVVVKAAGYEWPYLMLDGVHRQHAHHAAGLPTIWAIVERWPRSMWLARSVELNSDSKRPLDSGDKRWIAATLDAEGWKAEKIAKLLCMTASSFEKLMATSCQKLTKASAKTLPLGRSNRSIGDDSYGFLKAPFAEATGTANGQAALRVQGSVSSHDGRQIIESFIALLEARCVDMTDEHLARRLQWAGKLLDTLLGTVA